MRFVTLALLLLACAGRAEDLRLLSYNVRHGVNGANQPRFERQCAVIKGTKPDVVGLQEIDVNCRRSGSVDQTAAYAKATGTTGVFGKFMDYDGGQYGMAMLSRLKIVAQEVVRLPDGREPRVAVVLQVETAAGNRLQIANVHFDWTTSELRTPQAKALIAYLDKQPLPTIVLGDYNAEPGSPTLKLFSDAGFRFLEKPADNRSTWSDTSRVLEIDHVAIRDSDSYRLIGKSITVLPEVDASDHRPVTAVVHIEKR